MRETSTKVVSTLIAASDDSSVDVRDHVLQAFRVLAGKDVTGVTTQIADWLLEHKPSSGSSKQREVLIRSLHEVLKAHVGVGDLSSEIVEKVLKAAHGDMLAVSDLNNSWALEAVALFVHTADLDPARAMGLVTETIPTGAGGTTPFYILVTIAELANASPLRVVPHLKELLKRLVPLLGSVKQENPRMLFSKALRSIAAAVIHLEKLKHGELHVDPTTSANAAGDGEEGAAEDDSAGAVMSTSSLTPRSAPCAKLDLSSFAEVLNTACGHLVQEWSRISEARVRGPVLAAITTLSATLDDESRTKMFAQVANLAVAGVKREKPSDLAVVAEGCAAMCDIAYGDAVREVVVQNADAMLQCIAQAMTNISADKSHQESFSGPTHVAYQHFLRWAEHIAGCSVDAVVSFASKNFDVKTAAVKDAGFRAAIVAIIGHVVSRHSLTAKLQPYKDHIIATLKVVLNEGDLRVRRALAATVVAMATNNRVSFMAQVGAKDLLRFLVRCAALGVNAPPDAPEVLLREQCRQSMQVLCSSQAHLDDALTWPGIMEHISSYPGEPELLHVFPTVAKCLVPLGERVGESETGNFYVDFRVNVNMPPPGTLVALMCAHAALIPPTDKIASVGVKPVLTVLSAMEAIAPLLDEPFLHQHLEEVPTAIADLWLATLPELRNSLEAARDAAASGDPEQASSVVSPVEWEDLITKLVSRTVAARPEAEWVESIASGAMGLLATALAMPEDRPADDDSSVASYWSCTRDDLFRSLLGVAGAAFAKSPRRDLVVAGLDQALDVADPDRAAHRAGIARFLSAVAGNKEYVDVVMERLATLSRPPPEKKGFFASIMSKKNENESKRKVTDRSRAMSALGLCHCARRMPSAALSSRLEASVAPLLQQNLSEAPTVEIKHYILQSLAHLSAPLKKLSALSDVPHFKARDPLLSLVLSTTSALLENSPKQPESHLQAAIVGMEACTMLIQDMPALPPPTEFVDAFSTFLANAVVGCPCVTPTVNPTSDTVIVRALDLFAAVLDSCRVAQRPMSIDNALSVLLGLAASPDPGVRIRATALMIGILRVFLERADAELESEGTIAAMNASAGNLLAAFAIRIFDPEVTVRRAAIEGLSLMFKVHAFASPDAFGVDESDVAAALEAAKVVAAELKALKGRILGVDLSPAGNRVLVNKELSALNKSLCALLVRIMPTPAYFTGLLDALLAAGMRDPFADCLSTATVLLHGTVRGMGGLLSVEQAQQYVVKVVASAALVVERHGAEDETVLPSLFVSVRNLVKHHTEPCFDALVKKHETPHGPHVVKAIQAVAGDSALQQRLMNYCLDTMLNSPLLDEKNVINTAPLSAACCVGWISGVPKCETMMYETRSTIICVLALYGSSVLENNNAAAAQLVGESMCMFIRNTSSDVTKDRMERFGWVAFTQLGYDGFIAGVTEAIKYWNDEDNQGEELTTDNDREYDFQAAAEGGAGLTLPASPPSQTAVDIAEFIVAYADKPMFAHRRVAVSIVARSLVRHSVGDESLVQCLITCLLGRTGPDEQPPLRLESLCAFGEGGLLAHDDFEGGPEMLRTFLGPVTTALLSNLDEDRCPPIALVAAEVFRAVLRSNDKTHVQQGAIVNIMLKIKARFEHPDAKMRRACIMLFHTIQELALEGSIDRNHSLQQAHQFLVVLLAHAQEDDEQVRIASRKAATTSLQLMGTALGDEAQKAIAQLTERAALKIDDEFPSATPALFDETMLNEFGVMWVTHFPGRISDMFTACMSFFEAPQPALRMAAASVSSVVLKHLPPEEFGRTNAEQLCAALMRVARASSSSADLRSRAVRALGTLPVV